MSLSLQVARHRWAVALLLLLSALSWLSVTHEVALATLDASLATAFKSFALAKALNAAISVMQSATADAMVVQVQFGQALDPANDLVERFSWIMFASTASLAMQKILIQVAGHALIKALFSLSCLALALTLLWPASRWREWARRAFWLMAFLRFAVLAAALASAWTGDALIGEQRDGLYASLDRDRAVFQEVAETQAGARDDEGLWQRFKDKWDSAVGHPVRDLLARLDSMTENVVTLSAVFIVQTVVFPLGFLYLSWRLLGMLTTPVAGRRPIPRDA
ncbi:MULTISPECIES: hypothetical protein [Chromohalobacter]|jgi:hypothetical protein|uniref:hypothetical protein n=1 Tax=Chromohalobacter TaxID=42054 RepID=UPI000FFF0C57|nr:MULTISPECIES: hypothetical protein [Chromohalobacter]NQY45110.1 hypothetical protein [Chromohalobacter sp.]NWO56335.1 hypothetical protein [Chromohalobacter salexigens]RXE49146.1 hypothetical protein B4O83_14680 [Chromohalobacter salexigens]